MRPVRLLAGFLTVGAWTMLSRILGFVRDIMIAATLGAGPVAEAFLVAFALPNMFRRFFAEGAFNMAFVPMFAKRVEAGDDPRRFAQDAFAALAGVLIVLTLVAQLFMPWLVLAMAGGFAADERLVLATDYGRIVFVYILFISLAALLSGVLNALGRFWAAAAAPVLLNVILIGVLWFARATDGGATEGLEGAPYGFALSWGVVAAGIAQFALVWWAAHRAGMTLLPRRPRFTPEMRRLAAVAAPAALAGGVVQVNLLVGRQVASFFDGAIAWLSYADRLYQLPLGVVGIAIGVVLLPDLSRRLRAGDEAGGRHAFSRAAEMALTLTVPAAVALVVIPLPLIAVLFERGAFDAADSRATAAALAIYGLGLPAFVLQKVLQPLYYAREDTVRPLRYALVSLVVNAGIAIVLALAIGYLGAAIGTTVAGWAMVWLLWRGSQDMGEAASPDLQFRRRLPRILGAAAAMGVCLALAAWWLAGPLADPAWRYAALAALVGAGLGSYAAAGLALGAFSPRDLRGLSRRPAKARS